MSEVATTSSRPVPPRRFAQADRGLFERYAATRDPALRECLIRRYLPLARRLARRVMYGPEPLDDLVQVACIGLLNAIDRYDPARGTAFATFAQATIVGELQRHFRDRTWMVRPPRDVQELAVRADRVTTRMALQLGRYPTVPELAAELGATEEAVLEARHAARGRSLTSLDEPGGDGSAASLHELVGAPDDGFAAADGRIVAEQLVSTLEPRERAVVRLRIEQELLQREIGELVGLSQVHVGRLLDQALAQLAGAARDRGKVVAPC